MNLLENYIQEIYSVEDVTKHFIEKTNQEPKEPLIKVKLKVNCYGNVEDKVKIFFLSEWEEAQKQGYYMA